MGGAETILLVDDEHVVRDVAAEILRRGGYEVLTAANGAEALAVAGATGRIDVLLTDHAMPGMSGPELAEALLALRPSLKVVFMSGYAEQIDGDEAADVFLQKPFDASTLLGAVRQLLS